MPEQLLQDEGEGSRLRPISASRACSPITHSSMPTCVLWEPEQHGAALPIWATEETLPFEPLGHSILNSPIPSARSLGMSCVAKSPL